MTFAEQGNNIRQLWFGIIRDSQQMTEYYQELLNDKFKFFKKACHLFSPFFFVVFSYPFGFVHFFVAKKHYTYYLAVLIARPFNVAW